MKESFMRLWENTEDMFFGILAFFLGILLVFMVITALILIGVVLWAFGSTILDAVLPSRRKKKKQKEIEERMEDPIHREKVQNELNKRRSARRVREHDPSEYRPRENVDFSRTVPPPVRMTEDHDKSDT